MLYILALLPLYCHFHRPEKGWPHIKLCISRIPKQQQKIKINKHLKSCFNYIEKYITQNILEYNLNIQQYFVLSLICV